MFYLGTAKWRSLCMWMCGFLCAVKKREEEEFSAKGEPAAARRELEMKQYKPNQNIQKVSIYYT